MDKELQPGNAGEEITGELIDIEVYSRDGKKPPLGHKYKIKVGNDHYIFDHHIVTGSQIFEKVGIKHPECFWLFQKLKGCDFEKIDFNEKVDLIENQVEVFVIKPSEVFRYLIDGEPEMTDEKEMTPNKILADAGILPISDYYLVRINSDGTQDSFKDNPEKPIKMVCPAVKFVSAYRGETPVS